VIPNTSRSLPHSKAPHHPAARRETLDTRPVRLPHGGYYDPDSASFDEVRLSDVEGLFKATSPAEPVAAGRSAS
jgi:hypothetical protein